MRKILIFANSSSGKSTLVKALAKAENLAHLDLDTLAWLPPAPPERALPEWTRYEVSAKQIEKFMQSYDNWVIEGCYTDLLERAGPEATEIIFMNLSVAQCVENAKNRPWEPHEYASKEAREITT